MTPADPPETGPFSDDAVSVIMPVFNAADVLPRAVASVRAQTWQRWELLLIDDGSSDDSAAVAAGLAAQDPRIRLLRQPRNTGAAAARNAGLRHARGRYIAFLDADDEWLPEKLALQLHFMQAQGAAFSYTGFWRARNGRRHRVRVPAHVTRQELLKGNAIGCLTALYDRAHFGTVPMPELRLRQDYALWLDLLTRTDMAHGLDQPLAIHHRHRESLSASLPRALAANWHLYRRHLGLPPLQAFYFFSLHLWRRLKRG